jgi:hypothetical protein
MNYRKMRDEAVRRKGELELKLEQILKEQVRLNADREQAERELATVDQILDAVDSLDSSPPIEGEVSGTADYIRRTLQQTRDYLLPTQLRDLLVGAGVSGSSPQNVLIGVHNVLSRLKAHLETREINGRTAYRWNHHRKSKSLGSEK